MIHTKLTFEEFIEDVNFIIEDAAINGSESVTVNVMGDFYDLFVRAVQNAGYSTEVKRMGDFYVFYITGW